MAYFLVDGSTDAPGKSLVVQRRRNRVHRDRRIIHDLIDLLRAHAGADHGGYCVQAGHVHLCALFDPRDLFGRLYDASVRCDAALELKAPDFVVKAHMTVLILLSASAPAWVIPLYLGSKMDHIVVLLSIYITCLCPLCGHHYKYESFCPNCQGRVL